MRRLVLVALALGSCTVPGRDAPALLPDGTGTIVRPVDGDTVVVALSGVDEPVRLIGIDTPESVARDRPIECYGPEAKAIHGIDESVSLESIRDVTRVLAVFIAEWCGLEPIS